MSLTKFALERRTVTGTLIAVLIFAGVGAYFDAPRQMDPGFIIRTAMITTYFPGASPERVEQLITDPIEKVVQEIPELDWVNSESRTGVSVIYVNIREEFKEMRPIWDDLRRKVDSVEPNLPEDINGPFVDDEFGDVYPIMFSMTGDGFSYMELKDIADDLRDELLRIKSVAKVDILGAQEERLFVEYDNAVLSKHRDDAQVPEGLPPAAQHHSAWRRDRRRQRDHRARAERQLQLGRRAPPQRRSPAADRRAGLPRRHRRHLPRVRRSARSARPARGTPALTLAVSMAEGGNLIAARQGAQGFFNFIQEQYPHGVEFYQTYFQPTRVEKKVDDFVESVMQAVAIVLVVMLLTLGLRTGLVVATLVPVTMIIAMWAMSVFEHSARPDVAGGAHHRAGSAGRQCHRDLGVDHGAHGRGRRAASPPRWAPPTSSGFRS